MEKPEPNTIINIYVAFYLFDMFIWSICKIGFKTLWFNAKKNT